MPVLDKHEMNKLRDENFFVSEYSLLLECEVVLTGINSHTSPIKAFILRVKNRILWQSYPTRFLLSVNLYQSVRCHIEQYGKFYSRRCE